MIAVNVVVALSFLTALILLESLPLRKGGFGYGGFKLVMGIALAIYVFDGVSHILQFGGVTGAFGVYEDYIEILFIPLVAMGTLAGRVDEQLRDVRRQARVLTAEHDMLMRVVDTTLTGIAMVDASGRVEFVNERGRTLLGLAADPVTGGYGPPPWVLTSHDAPNPVSDFSRYVVPTPLRDAECTLRWPDGHSVPLTISATPVAAVDGSVTGAVLAFSARPQPVAT